MGQIELFRQEWIKFLSWHSILRRSFWKDFVHDIKGVPLKRWLHRLQYRVYTSPLCRYARGVAVVTRRHLPPITKYDMFCYLLKHLLSYNGILVSWQGILMSVSRRNKDSNSVFGTCHTFYFVYHVVMIVNDTGLVCKCRLDNSFSCTFSLLS
jgi:hypothetical protein